MMGAGIFVCEISICCLGLPKRYSKKSLIKGNSPFFKPFSIAFNAILSKGLANIQQYAFLK
jgi:hypothetical protein